MDSVRDRCWKGSSLQTIIWHIFDSNYQDMPNDRVPKEIPFHEDSRRACTHQPSSTYIPQHILIEGLTRLRV